MTINYPEKIENLLLELLVLDDKLRDKNAVRRAIEAAVTLDAVGAKDDKGKLVLTNDKQREAAVAQLLGESGDYRKTSEDIRELDRERQTVLAALERYRLEARFELEAARNRNALEEVKAAEAINRARYPRTESGITHDRITHDGNSPAPTSPPLRINWTTIVDDIEVPF